MISESATWRRSIADFDSNFVASDPEAGREPFSGTIQGFERFKGCVNGVQHRKTNKSNTPSLFTQAYGKEDIV